MLNIEMEHIFLIFIFLVLHKNFANVIFYFIMKIALEVQKRSRTYNENTHYKQNKKYYPKLISANTVNNGVDIVKNKGWHIK